VYAELVVENAGDIVVDHRRLQQGRDDAGRESEKEQYPDELSGGAGSALHGFSSQIILRRR
jgi:hypothetical protein